MNPFTPGLHQALVADRRRQLIALHVPAAERWWRRTRRSSVDAITGSVPVTTGATSRCTRAEP